MAKRLSAALLISLLLAACGGPRSEPKVTKAWVRLSPLPGRPAAGYFILENAHGDDAIVRIESALAKRIEMHESMVDAHGMSAMKPLERAPLPSNGRTEFKPGSQHLMLFDVDPAITPGTAIPLRFGFASGKTTEAEAKTVAAGEDAPY